MKTNSKYRFIKLLTPTIILFSASASAIDIKFDYSYDETGFFSDPLRREILDIAALQYENVLNDSLSKVTNKNIIQRSTISDAYLSPGVFRYDYQGDISIEKNELLIFVGASDQNKPSNTNSKLTSSETGRILANGAAGSYATFQYNGWIKGDDYIALMSRGQEGVIGVVNGVLAPTGNDFAPWGGGINFDENTDWHFSKNISDKTSFSGYDFYSVALHEIGHVLGVGNSPSWSKNLIYQDDNIGYQFIGNNSIAINNGTPISLDRNAEHFADGLSQSPLMSGSILEGQRKNLTQLDYAALRDVGWEVSPVPEPDTWAMITIGLGIVALGARNKARK